MRSCYSPAIKNVVMINTKRFSASLAGPILFCGDLSDRIETDIRYSVNFAIIASIVMIIGKPAAPILRF